MALNFYSQANYLKIFEEKRYSVVSLSSSFGSNSEEFTITHNLGYVPSISLWVDQPDGGVAQNVAPDFDIRNVAIGPSDIVGTTLNQSGSTATYDIVARIYYDKVIDG